MTPEQFVFWLRGFLMGTCKGENPSLYVDETKELIKVLNDVRCNEIHSIFASPREGD
jgi:hypothetical protein